MSDTKPLIIPASSPLEEAVEAVKRGGVVAYPTETFYGLGCDPFNPESVKRLFVLKGREIINPVSIIIEDRKALDYVVRVVPSRAEWLMERFWPGPLTIIFEASDRVPQALIGGGHGIGVRISSSPYTQRFISALHAPLTATSANPSGAPPPSTAEEVVGYFGGSLDVVIDGGRLTATAPSTVVDVTGHDIKVLREGAIPVAEILPGEQG